MMDDEIVLIISLDTLRKTLERDAKGIGALNSVDDFCNKFLDNSIRDPNLAIADLIQLRIDQCNLLIEMAGSGKYGVDLLLEKFKIIDGSILLAMFILIR